MRSLTFDERFEFEVDCRLISLWELIFLAQIVDEQAALLGHGVRLAYARGYHRHDFGQGNLFSADDDELDLALLDIWALMTAAVEDWSERDVSLLPMLLRNAHLRGWMDAAGERPFGAAPEGYPDLLWLPV